MIFYDKCCDCGDYIAFILPISCYKNDIKLYKFDLIYSEDLGLRYYTDRELHCCFNIYRRPTSGAGTTCTVCERLGRRYIGTDISEQYCKTAIERIEYEKCLKEDPLWE